MNRGASIKAKFSNRSVSRTPEIPDLTDGDQISLETPEGGKFKRSVPKEISLRSANLLLSLFLVGRILKRDPAAFAFVVAVCAMAATVATLQFAVFSSFLYAGAAVPRSLGGQVWIVAKGVPCFDFPTAFGEDYDALMLRYLPGARFRRVVFGFAQYRSPLGNRSSVALVGVDGPETSETTFIAGDSDLPRLDLKSVGQAATLGNTTLHLGGAVSTFRTFLGAPYVLASFPTSRRLLGIGQTETSFLIADLPQGLEPDFERRRVEASRDFPEIEMLTAKEFEAKSSGYWQEKTGAGAAILLSAVLAGLLMVVLLVNGILRFLQRYQDDLISLIGHGGGKLELRAVLVMVAALVSISSLSVAILATPILTLVLQPVLPWVNFGIRDVFAPALLALLSLAIATFAADRALAAFPPDVVFRT